RVRHGNRLDRRAENYSSQLSAIPGQAHLLSTMRLVPRRRHACRPVQSLEPHACSAPAERWGHAERRKRRIHAEHHHSGRQRPWQIRDDAALWENALHRRNLLLDCLSASRGPAALSVSWPPSVTALRYLCDTNFAHLETATR